MHKKKLKMVLRENMHMQIGLLKGFGKNACSLNKDDASLPLDFLLSLGKTRTLHLFKRKKVKELFGFATVCSILLFFSPT